MQERPGTFFSVVLSVVLTVLIGVDPAHVRTMSTSAVDVTFCGQGGGHIDQVHFETRYPGPFEPVTAEEYQEAVHLATAVVARAESILIN